MDAQALEVQIMLTMATHTPHHIKRNREIQHFDGKGLSLRRAKFGGEHISPGDVSYGTIWNASTDKYPVLNGRCPIGTDMIEVVR